MNYCSVKKIQEMGGDVKYGFIRKTDLDGNLTNDGRFAYTWDAENRLIAVESATQKVENAYDYMSRRIDKKVSAWQTDHWALVSDRCFVYDGWAMIRELGTEETNDYIYGLDLSGTLQAAGTIGGILARVSNGDPAFYAYDANGNVTELVNPSGDILAHYEYDPYGNLLASSGPLATSNPFRFSSKFSDDETALVYYGFRWYLPELGRWLGRDPIGEVGGWNLYGFTDNHVIDAVDYLGYLAIYFGGAMEVTLGQLPGFMRDVRADVAYGCNQGAQVIEKIKETVSNNSCEPIIIVGHSWGGDTALNVAAKLENIECLSCLYIITLDPVSHLNPRVWFDGPDIGKNVKEWINVAQPAGPMDVVFDIPVVGWLAGGLWSLGSAIAGSPNGVATGGGQWNMESKASINIPAVDSAGRALDHHNVYDMMNLIVPGKLLPVYQYVQSLKTRSCCK